MIRWWKGNESTDLFCLEKRWQPDGCKPAPFYIALFMRYSFHSLLNHFPYSCTVCMSLYINLWRSYFQLSRLPFRFVSMPKRVKSDSEILIDIPIGAEEATVPPSNSFLSKINFRKLTVPDLRQILQRLNLPTFGRKQDLVCSDATCKYRLKIPPKVELDGFAWFESCEWRLSCIV